MKKQVLAGTLSLSIRKNIPTSCFDQIVKPIYTDTTSYSFYIYDNISYKILQEIFNKIARDLLLLANEAVKFKH